ncbi:Uncharacterised protein [Bordetella pertussis]|nr:Uncharacterised protein [Bordetella pertussis]
MRHRNKEQIYRIVKSIKPFGNRYFSRPLFFSRTSA